MSEDRDEFARLLKAAYEGRSDKIRARLDSGLDVNTADIFGSSPLHSAVRGRRHELVSFLLERGADPNRPGGSFQRTALHYAAVDADAEMIGLLLAAGADVHARTGSGHTPLMAAALTLKDERGQEAIVRALCAAGDDVAAVDQHGGSPLHYAAFDDKPGITRALVAAGADVSAVDENGWTPLHTAASVRALKAAAVLLEAGARADAKSSAPGYVFDDEYPAGITPIDVAKTVTENKSPSPEMVALLELHHAKRRPL